MIEKIFKTLLRIIIFILVYLLQIYVINNVDFFGVTGNLCLMLVAVVAMLDGNIMAYFTATICGLVADLIFSSGSLKYVLIYIIVNAILIELKKTYKQDSKFSIIIFSVSATVIAEIIMIIFMIATKLEFVNLFVWLYNIFKLSVINIFLSYGVYLVLKPCKYEE